MAAAAATPAAAPGRGLAPEAAAATAAPRPILLCGDAGATLARGPGPKKECRAMDGREGRSR